MNNIVTSFELKTSSCFLPVFIFLMTACQSQNKMNLDAPIPIESTKDLLSYWKTEYTDETLKAFSFVQTTIRYENGQVKDTSIWYEAIEYPNSFRIDFGDKTGNSNLYRNDSIYVLRNGQIVHKDREIQEFLLIEGGTYTYEIDTVLARLERTGVDTEKFRKTTLNDRTTYVIGANEGDDSSPQIWLDSIHRGSVKRIIARPDNKVLLVTYDQFQNIDGFEIESWLEFFLDGVLIQTEEYRQIMTNPDFDPDIFHPTKFRNTFWY